MSVNLSGSSTDTHLPPSIHSDFLYGLVCLFTQPISSIFITFTVGNLLFLLPLCLGVIHQGLQRWRQQRFSSTAASHSDTFSYHLVTMELINAFGSILCFYAISTSNFTVLLGWYTLFCFMWYGETFFHVVTCVEHYLAVIHPITYRSLRQEKGIRIRKCVIGSIWLLTISGAFITAVGIDTAIIDACLVCTSVVVISFCSLSVLWALLHPGPGDQGQDQRRLTQSKQRAFYTILIILGVLMVRLIVTLAWGTLCLVYGKKFDCSWVITGLLCNLPSSLVLPLLFLHRVGKLTWNWKS